jgi:succinate-acetate transporter protein
MHCPSCGQQQISNETKFCSRCGLPLSIVSEVVSYGGYLPQLAELDNKKKTLYTRRNGVAFSIIWLLFFLLIMAPLWGILDVDKLAGASAVIGIFGGLIWLIITLFFFKKEPTFTPGAHMYGQPGQ